MAEFGFSMFFPTIFRGGLTMTHARALLIALAMMLGLGGRHAVRTPR